MRRVQEPTLDPSSIAQIDLKRWNRSINCCSAQGSHAAIASPGEHSSKIGIEILRRGGNSVDAAVAVAFALSVEVPEELGLGGGGFMTLHLTGAHEGDYFVDFREIAPHRATRNMYIDAQGKPLPEMSQKGVLSVGVPGFVAGLYEIHQKWGSLPWKKIVQPAIHLARDGFLINPSLSHAMVAQRDELFKSEYTRRLFFHDNELLRVGDKLIQRDLSHTLQAIAKGGRKGFYSGPVAKKITDYIVTRGGILDREDFDRYVVKFRQPIIKSWKGKNIVTAPPPSAGGVLLVESLNVLGEYDLEEIVEQPAVYVHLLTEVFKYAYADRSRFIGDPDFIQRNYAYLMTREYADRLRKRLNHSRDIPSAEIHPGDGFEERHHNTGHFSLMSEDGSAISATLTINDDFGAKFAIPGVGVFMNDEMDDFSMKPGERNIYGLTGEEENAIAPGKRPASSMTPTIVLEGNTPRLVLGCAGGSRIMTSVMEVMLNDLLIYPGKLKYAIFAPRFHHQWLPDQLELEEGFSSEQKKALISMGHRLAPWPFRSRVQAVQRDASGGFTAVFDPRGGGGAEAY